MMVTPGKFKKAFALALFLSAISSAPVIACDTNIVLAALTLDEAVKGVKNREEGKVLNAETVEIEGEAVHVIKVLTKSGRVKKIRVNTEEKK